MNHSAERSPPFLEKVALIDDSDRVIGWARRGHVRRLNLLHRGVGIFCANSAGEIYVHRRTTSKDVFPGLYDMFVGGVVGEGEDYRDAAGREIAEELGIVGPEPRYLQHYLYLGPHNRALVAVYSVTWDGPIHHQEEEIDWGAYVTRQELEQKLLEWEFVPDGLAIYRCLESKGTLEKILSRASG